MESVWVFNGVGGRFPSGVFRNSTSASEWIRFHKLSGCLTEYPLDAGIYDLALEKGWFSPNRDDQKSAAFIGQFSAANQKHLHYEDGIEQ